jgi:hypothetical protein
MAPPIARVATTFSVMNTIATRSRIDHLPFGRIDLSPSAPQKDLARRRFLRFQFAICKTAGGE